MDIHLFNELLSVYALESPSTMYATSSLVRDRFIYDLYNICQVRLGLCFQTACVVPIPLYICKYYYMINTLVITAAVAQWVKVRPASGRLCVRIPAATD